MDQAIGAVLPGLIQNLGFFGPAALLGWWIIKNQRADLIAERDRYRTELADERKRNDALIERVFALAESGEKTVKELTAAINGIQ